MSSVQLLKKVKLCASRVPEPEDDDELPVDEADPEEDAESLEIAKCDSGFRRPIRRRSGEAEFLDARDTHVGV